MKTRPLIGAMIFLVAVPVQASESPTRRWKITEVAFGAAACADAWTSLRAFHNGSSETDPALPKYPTDGRLLAQGVLFDGGLWLLARHVRPMHPRLAEWLIGTAAVIHGGMAIRNGSATRGLSGRRRAVEFRE